MRWNLCRLAMLAKNVYVLAHTAAGARCTPTAPETRMGSQQATDVGRWRKIVELGSGRTGNVTLCIEPNSLPANSSAAENTCCESKHDVLHAVKRVHRQCMTNNSGAVRRILQEKKALEALKGVSEVTAVVINAARNFVWDGVFLYVLSSHIFWTQFIYSTPFGVSSRPTAPGSLRRKINTLECFFVFPSVRCTLLSLYSSTTAADYLL